MPSGKKVSWKVVQSVANEMGLKFKRLQKAAVTAEGTPSLDIKGLDPNMVYLLDNNRGRPVIIPPAPGKVLDGILYYKKKRMQVCGKDTNLSPKMYIRKLLKDRNTCEICFEHVGDREGAHCAKCHFQKCNVCATKVALTEDAVDQILSNEFVTNRRCPGCRFEFDTDIRSEYHQVLDRLDMFSSRQQQALLHAKKHDPLARKQMTLWVEKHPLRYYKPGVFVELHGLKTKAAWNGKIAKIIDGGRINDKDQLRLGIQLKGSKQKALLLQNNMMPREQDVGSDRRAFYETHFPNPCAIECCGLTPHEFILHQMMRDQMQ